VVPCSGGSRGRMTPAVLAGHGDVRRFAWKVVDNAVTRAWASASALAAAEGRAAPVGNLAEVRAGRDRTPRQAARTTLFLVDTLEFWRAGAGRIGAGGGLLGTALSVQGRICTTTEAGPSWCAEKRWAAPASRAARPARGVLDIAVESAGERGTLDIRGTPPWRGPRPGRRAADPRLEGGWGGFFCLFWLRGGVTWTEVGAR